MVHVFTVRAAACSILIVVLYGYRHIYEADTHTWYLSKPCCPLPCPFSLSIALPVVPRDAGDDIKIAPLF